MPIVRNVSDLQNILKGWMRRPNETDDEYRDRLNDPSNEVSFGLPCFRDMVTEQIENERVERATPVYPSIDATKAIEMILTKVNKKDDNDAGS